jgi:DivIVA domain-containing protein
MRKKEQDMGDEQGFSAPAPPAASKPLSPVDIQEKEFRVQRMGGYRMRDVDEFLDQVTEALSGALAENQRLRQGGTGSAAPVVGTADLADVNRQADEIIQRARDEAGRITAEAREQAAAFSATGAVAAAGVATDADRAAINAFLVREKEFLQSLAGLVQGHAETVKSMARSARSGAPAPAPAPAKAQTSPATKAPLAQEPKAAVPPAPVKAAPAKAEPTVTLPKGDEPVRVQEPEPASVGRSDGDADDGSGDDSLRELFWGED